MKKSTIYIIGGVSIGACVLVIILAVIFLIRRPVNNFASSEEIVSSSGLIPIGEECDSNNCVPGAFCAAVNSTTGICVGTISSKTEGGVHDPCIDNPDCQFGLTCQFGTCQPPVEGSQYCSEENIRKCTVHGASDCLPVPLGYAGEETCQWGSTYNNSTDCGQTLGLWTPSFSLPATVQHAINSKCINQVTNLDATVPTPCSQQGLFDCLNKNATFCLNSSIGLSSQETCQYNNNATVSACDQTTGDFQNWTGFAKTSGNKSCLEIA